MKTREKLEAKLKKEKEKLVSFLGVHCDSGSYESVEHAYRYGLTPINIGDPEDLILKKLVENIDYTKQCYEFFRSMYDDK